MKKKSDRLGEGHLAIPDTKTKASTKKRMILSNEEIRQTNTTVLKIQKQAHYMWKYESVGKHILK